ncbi:MAG: hypothetical protein ACJA1A_002811 [Saprospiraceae bacterium]|jgi:hypothetical protein
MKKTENIIGLILFTLYLLQYLAQLEFDYLTQLQTNSTYRHWSGFVLFLFILGQWVLPIFRGVFDMKGKAIERMHSIHNLLGVTSPIVFYLHSSRPDYGLLLLLTVVFFMNLLVGLSLNCDSYNKYFRFGLVLHVIMSAQIMISTILHIWIVFIYN